MKDFQGIPAIARLLGFDASQEPQYLWIARLASEHVLDPSEWKEFTNEKGLIVYYNVKLKKLQTVHPTVSEFSRIYQRQRGFHAGLFSESDDNEVSAFPNGFDFIAELNSRLNRKLPVSTPEIVGCVGERLSINRTLEPYLLRVVRSTIEHYASKQFDFKFLISDMLEPIRSLRRIDGRKVKEDIVHKPQSIIMCQECEKRSSVLKCEQCLDHFCQECFDMLHATGNRKLHFTQEVEQLVCVSCDMKVAECQCIQCGSFFCNSCFGSIHAIRSDLHKHRRRAISGLVCQECEHAHAGVICEDCVDLFCSPCFLRLHNTGNKKSHSHLTVDANSQVFRRGLLIDQSEANALIDRSRLTLFSDPKIEFLNDNGDSFSHSFVRDPDLSL